MLLQRWRGRRFRRLGNVVICFPLVGFSPGDFGSRSAPRVSELLHVLDFGDFLALAQSTGLFAGGAMDAVSALAAVLFDLTRTALHASVAPLRLTSAVAAAVVVVAANAGRDVGSGGNVFHLSRV